ncbi:hypothetical protein GCM10011581_06390 [Saccharopolyspora subtropica]|uniref:ATP-dependent Clp protease adapter protein ClpS n=2 Tax=Saccharopolyspora thermophila TaxID=89367 RepID=A0A917N7I0_9PSEU|nr:hypothetical protein GCM10011581_06390 [Saccharopolyspora subtropica]
MVGEQGGAARRRAHAAEITWWAAGVRIAKPVRAGFARVADTAVTGACDDGGMTSPAEIERAQLEPDELGTEDRPWVTVVWNDPVNLMSYVTYVLQKIFGYTRDHATKLMLDVHHKGKAVVSSGSKEKVEGDVAKLHAAGLWATMQKDS